MSRRPRGGAQILPSFSSAIQAGPLIAALGNGQPLAGGPPATEELSLPIEELLGAGESSPPSTAPEESPAKTSPGEEQPGKPDPTEEPSPQPPSGEEPTPPGPPIEEGTYEQPGQGPSEESPPTQTNPPEGPPVETNPPETPPAETPPAETPPAEEPPAETPPAETPPTETPPTETTPPEAPAEEPPTPTTPGESPAPPQETPPSEPPATTPPQEEPKAPPAPEAPVLTGVQGETFGGQPSDVLLTYSSAVHPSDAPRCVGLDSAGNTETFGGIDQGPSAQTIRLELAPGGGMPSKVRCSAGNATNGAGTPSPETEAIAVTRATSTQGGVVSDPIDPKYLSEVPFGDRSFWVQPWRSYMDTWPASRLLGSLGINFNVGEAEAQNTAHLLQDSGFTLARIEISWNDLSYANPTKLVNETKVRKLLEALHAHDLRPLILLDSNSNSPTPSKEVTLTTTASAASGSRTVTLNAASAANVVPGKTGFDDLAFGGNPDILITQVEPGGVATLSKPLPAALPAGAHPGATLLYAPFGPPKLSNGESNPAFQETAAGWRNYVATICKLAAGIFGPSGYDLEVWNELSFGSQFINQTNYYSPARETGSGSITEALLDETVAFVRSPSSGIPAGVGITDGFASQTPFASGALTPDGLTALSKHLYSSNFYFPADQTNNSIMPINALGEPDAKNTGTKANPIQTPLFTPTYLTYMPEYFLTATQTESEVRDLAPITTKIYGVPHGRSAAPEGESPPQEWMTEYNINSNTLLPDNPEHPDYYDGPHANAAQGAHLQAEILLRSLVSMISKGMTREYFYAAAGEGWNLVDEGFLGAAKAKPSVYPGDSRGGVTMEGFRHMLGQFQGPGPEGPARQLSLVSITQEGNHAQFSGDGTAAHPALYDREMLAVDPFQSAPARFVIPIYVMTENLTTVYKPGEPESAIDRYEFPEEKFRITLGNLPETSATPNVSAYDPLRNESTPARFVSRTGDEAVFEIAATNYPRLLLLDYTGK